MAPLAAENEEETLVVSMMNLPRSWHWGTKLFSSHSRSVSSVMADLPLILALVKSGNCVLEWFPQMVMQVTASLGTPAFMASAETARLWSRRVMACQRSAGIPLPLRYAMRQFVLHGL